MDGRWRCAALLFLAAGLAGAPSLASAPMPVREPPGNTAANPGTTPSEGYLWMAEQEWSRAVQDLTQGAPRRQVADQLARWLQSFPDSPLRAQVAELQPLLAAQAVEDEHLPSAPAPNAPAAERAAYGVIMLRDAQGQQTEIPGTCFVTRAPQAKELLALGRDAIPALIAALPDARPIRSYGFRSDASTYRVLRIGDAVLQILEAITHQHFYDPSSTVSYLHAEPPEKREAVIGHIKEWWARNSGRSVRQWITAQLGNPQPWLRMQAIWDLYREAGKDAVPGIRPLLKDPDNWVRVTAAKALSALDDGSGLRVMRPMARALAVTPPEDA